ncbi:hypothetical protein ACLOJK_015104 [Asimina triloba]
MATQIVAPINARIAQLEAKIDNLAQSQPQTQSLPQPEPQPEHQPQPQPSPPPQQPSPNPPSPPAPHPEPTIHDQSSPLPDLVTYDPQIFTIEELLGLPPLHSRTSFTPVQTQTKPVQIDSEAIDSDPHLHASRPSLAPSHTSPLPQLEHLQPKPYPQPPTEPELPSQPTTSQPYSQIKQMAHKPKRIFIRISPEPSQIPEPTQPTLPPNPPTQLITSTSPSQDTPPTIFTTDQRLKEPLPHYFTRKRKKPSTP